MQLGAGDAARQAVDLPADLPGGAAEPGVQVQPLNPLAHLDDIADIFALDAVVGDAPEGQDVVVHLLQLHHRGGGLPRLLQLIEGQLDIGHRLAADLLPEGDADVIGPSRLERMELGSLSSKQ